MVEPSKPLPEIEELAARDLFQEVLLEYAFVLLARLDGEPGMTIERIEKSMSRILAKTTIANGGDAARVAALRRRLSSMNETFFRTVRERHRMGG